MAHLSTCRYIFWWRLEASTRQPWTRLGRLIPRQAEQVRSAAAQRVRWPHGGGAQLFARGAWDTVVQVVKLATGINPYLTTDGVTTDGLATDGLTTDGLATDGLATDGLATDGLTLTTDNLSLIYLLLDMGLTKQMITIYRINHWVNHNLKWINNRFLLWWIITGWWYTLPTPLEKMSSSVWMMNFPYIMEK